MRGRHLKRTAKWRCLRSPCSLLKSPFQRSLVEFFAETILLILIAFCAGGSYGQGGSIDILNEALDETNLQVVGTPTYHLHARIKFSPDSGRNSLDTELTVYFETPTSWREEIEADGVTALKLATKDRLWREGLNVDMLNVLRIESARNFSSRMLPFPGGKASKPDFKRLDGRMAECIKFSSGPSIMREVCIDSTSGLPMRINDKNTDVQIDFEPYDYLQLGTKRFPRHIRYGEHGRTILEMDVDTLQPIDNHSQDLFIPPSGATFLPWCSNERPPRPLYFGGTHTSSLQLPGGTSHYTLTFPAREFALIVFDVASDGHVKELNAYDKQGAIMSQSAEAEKLRESLFRPATCGNNPVEGEFIFWPQFAHE